MILFERIIEKNCFKFEKRKKTEVILQKNAFKNGKILKKLNFALAKSFNRM